jgi:CHRD domain
MERFRALFLPVVVSGLVVAAGTSFAAAPKPKTVAFKGSYAGQVREKVDGQNVTALASGTGVGTVVGKGKLLGTVAATTANPPCSPLSGTGAITGPKGNLTVTLLPTSRGCAASEQDQSSITFSGTAKVTGGTLTFKKAKGSIHFSGNYNRTNGAFNAKLTGTLTYYVPSKAVAASKSAMTIKAAMLGKYEVPKGSPTASGTATVKLDAKTGKVCWTFKVKGLDTVTAAHIHKAPKAKSGKVVIAFFAGKLKATGCVTASKSLVAAIEKTPTAYYVNIHTVKYPTGAIRGQL